MPHVEEVEREEAALDADQAMFDAERAATPTPLERTIRARYAEMIAPPTKRFGPVGMARGMGLSDLKAFEACVCEFSFVAVVRALKLASAHAKELNAAYWRSPKASRR